MANVLLFGTFDIVHLGHLNLFDQAREYGDHLTVVVARDKRVTEIKGQPPVHTEDERVAFLQHIKGINDVRLGHETDVYESVRLVQPDVICLGYDQRVYVDQLEDKLIALGLAQTEIIRLSPYNADTKKSSTLKQRLLETL